MKEREVVGDEETSIESSVEVPEQLHLLELGQEGQHLSLVLPYQ